jgi:hypothetical protein
MFVGLRVAPAEPDSLHGGNQQPVAGVDLSSQLAQSSRTGMDRELSASGSLIMATYSAHPSACAIQAAPVFGPYGLGGSYFWEFVAAYLLGIMFQYFSIAPMRNLSGGQASRHSQSVHNLLTAFEARITPQGRLAGNSWRHPFVIWPFRGPGD